MITLDTSGLIALFDVKDHHHASCVDALRQSRGARIIPAAILAELGWFLEQRFPPTVEQALLDDIEQGAYTTDWNSQDVVRIRALTARYQDLPLGLSDAAVIACAERHGGMVLTTDFRHFSVVARGERTITPLPHASSH
jgi:predicted nucleic acid-binding protein